MALENNGGDMVMPVAPLYGNGGSNGGGLFGNGNGDGWWIILLFILLGGWGGYGNGGGYSGGAADNYVLTSDFAQVERKLDTITNGICDSSYANAQLINGTNTAILTQANALGSQMASCCCDIREGVQGVNYAVASTGSAIQNTICGSTRDIIESQNSGTRAILEALNAQNIEAKNDKIASLERELQMATLSASQTAQTAYLEAKLGPASMCPVPAYVVPNPNCCYQSNGCGCGSY